MRNIAFLLSLAVVACTPLRPSLTSRTEPASSTAPLTVTGEDWGREMLRHVNALRAKGCRCGGKRMPAVPALEWSAPLYQAALVHSRDMARHDHFDHTGTDRSSVSERVARFQKGASYVGENIAWASWVRTPQEVVDALQESPGHCKNMMNANYVYFAAADVDNYTTQVLAGSF